MAWNEAVVTAAGIELLARCLTGRNVVISKAVGGESVSAALSLMALKSIGEPCHELNLFRIENEGGRIVVNLRVQNKGLSEEYTLRQIGLFARLEGDDSDDNNDSDVLFAVIQDSVGEVIPKESDNPEFLTEFDFVIPVSNADKISVEITPNTFATGEDIVKVEKEIGEHISDKGNPHGVTKAQVGLGNVPDVATNDQTPTYTAAVSLGELTGGEKLSIAFGKIAKAVKELISHIADNVRHITAAERTDWNSKAAGNHTHLAATQSAAGLMSADDKKKLDGVAASANNYSLPAATSTARGGVKVGYTANGKNYPVQLSNEQMYVNVPWTDNNTTYSNMKGASASADGAAGLVPAPTKGNQAKYLRADGTWQTPPDTNTTYSAATTAAAGLMSAADKTKLDGIATGANNYTYTLPAATSTVRGGVKVGYTANGKNYPVQLSNEQMYVNVPWTDNNTTYSNMTAATASAAGKAGLVPAPAAGAQAKYLRGDGTWQTPPDTNTTYSNATTSAAGLMSAADKTKLNNTQSIASIVQGTISSLTTSTGNYYIPNNSKATKALVEYWTDISFFAASTSGGSVTKFTNSSNYGSRYITGISSSMTAVSASAILSGSTRTANVGVDATGRPYFSGSVNTADHYRVTWYL